MLCAFLGYAARSFIALQVQKRRAGVISGLLRHLATRCGGLRWAGAKATRRGALPASGSVYRPAAPLCDGQEQKRRAGVRSGLWHRLPIGCASLRWAGAKAACRGDLRPVASGDALRRSAMGRSKSHLLGCAPACGTVYRRVAAFCDGQGQKPPAGVRSGQRQRLPTGCASLRWAGAKAARRGDLRPAAAASTDRLRRSTIGRGKSHLPGCASCLRHLPTRCGGLRWAGAKSACRGVLRPDVPSADALCRPTMGRGKSDAPGCAPARRAVCRRAAAAYDGQGQKRRAGVCFPPAASGDALRRPTMGRSKSHLPGCALACCGIWRRAAAFCDGQGQKRRAGVISGQTRRLPTGCGVLRLAGVKATCRGVLPACGICRRAAAAYDGQE